MKTFNLFWLDGKTERIRGNNITEAFNNSGYSAGALRVLDYYKEATEIPVEEKTVYVKNDEICNPSFVNQLREFAKNNSCGSVAQVNFVNRTFEYVLLNHTGTEIYYS